MYLIFTDLRDGAGSNFRIINIEIYKALISKLMELIGMGDFNGHIRAKKKLSQKFTGFLITFKFFCMYFVQKTPIPVRFKVNAIASSDFRYYFWEIFYPG